MTTKLEALRTKAAEIAALIGATSETHESDMWRAFAETADGLKLIFTMEGGKNRVRAYLPRPNHPGHSWTCGDIGVSMDRPAEALARDIERRLLVPAREAAANARTEWATLEAKGKALQALQMEFDALPNCRATLTEEGRAGQQLKVSYYDAGKASLSFTVAAHGSVWVDRLHLSDSDNAANLDRVRAVMAALQ